MITSPAPHVLDTIMIMWVWKWVEGGPPASGRMEKKARG